MLGDIDSSCTGTPQPSFKTPQVPSNRDHQAVNKATCGALVLDPQNTQRAQNGLIKEYTLKYIGILNMIEGIFPKRAILGSLDTRIPGLGPAKKGQGSEPKSSQSGCPLMFVYIYIDIDK